MCVQLPKHFEEKYNVQNNLKYEVKFSLRISSAKRYIYIYVKCTAEKSRFMNL